MGMESYIMDIKKREPGDERVEAKKREPGDERVEAPGSVKRADTDSQRAFYRGGVNNDDG